MNKDSLFNDALIESYIEWKADAIIAKKLKKVVIEKIEIPPIGEIDSAIVSELTSLLK